MNQIPSSETDLNNLACLRALVKVIRIAIYFDEYAVEPETLAAKLISIYFCIDSMFLFSAVS